MAILAGVALTSGASNVLAQASDVAVGAPDIATGRPQMIISNDPMRFFLPAPAAGPARGPFDSRGSVTFYTSTTQPGNVVNLGTGGCPAGSGVLPDICVDDIPIPAARLALPGGELATRIAICQITVGVRQAVGAPSTDVNAWCATVRNDTVAPDTAFDTPMTKALDGTSPTSTLAGSPFLGQPVSRNVPANTTGALRTFEVTVGDGINPIAGLESVPLNMNYAVAGGVPATFGTIAIGTQIGETASNTNRLRFTTGPDGSLNQIWIFDDEMSNGQAPCSTISTPETGPWAFSATTPVANFYTIVKGTLITPTTPMRCCLATTTASGCVVTNSAADCTLSGGTIIPGQTTCGTGVCTPIVCCNNTTGVCSTQFGTCPAGAGVLVAGTSCTGVTCTQPTAPANDECAAATTGSAFELTVPGNPTLASQVLVGATASAGYAGGINNCTFAPSDVWYLLTLTPAQSTQQWRVTVTPEASSGDYTLQPVAVAVYDGGGGCPAAPGGELVCADFANPQTAFFTGTGSTSYYVRVAYFDPETTRFSISLSQVVIIACCSPANGLCVLSDNTGACSNPSYSVPAPGGATTCTPTNPCPIGACCGVNGACALSGSGPGGCAPANYQGDGTTCTPTNPCGGACCNNTTFQCTFTNAAGCGVGSTFTANGTVCTTVGVCPAPPNDLCPGVALTLNVAATGFISSAQGTDLTSCSTSSVDVWYNFTAPTTGNYAITATPASVNDAGVAIATFLPPCDPVADSDIDCLPQPAPGEVTELLTTLTAGQNVLIRVGGFPGNNGQFSIVVTQPAGLGACCGISSACLIVAQAADCPAPAEYRGVNTTCASPATQCPPGACCFPLSGQCFVTLQGFCTGVTGTWNGADATCGTTTCTQGVPTNDACPGTTITSPTFSSNVGTEGASNEGLPAGTCNSAAAQTVGANNSIWYQFTAPSNGILNIQVDDWTGYDLFMSVYTGTCATLTEIGCFDEPEPIEVNATLTNGTTIFIMIAAWDVTGTGGWTSLNTSFSATGSCCVGTTCTLGVTQAACTGTWNGANSTCTPDPCVPTGICCRGATCNTTTTQAACTTTGFLAGATFPAGPACSGSTFTGCCYGDYNKTGGVTVGDIFDFLNDWFAGSPFANTGGNGNGGALAVQNIFDFLNSWFAGCV